MFGSCFRTLAVILVSDFFTPSRQWLISAYSELRLREVKEVLKKIISKVRISKLINAHGSLRQLT